MKLKKQKYLLRILNFSLFIILIYISSSAITSCFFNETLVEVPSVVNLEKDEAEKILKKYKLKANMISSRSLDVPLNYVYSQSPEAGSKVKKNRGIKLYINDDNGEKVPDLVGLTLIEALRVLEENKIEVKRVDYVFSEETNNMVLSTYPKKNTRLVAGSKISLLVSTKDVINSNKMPNIVGLDVNEANSVLSQIGLKINNITKSTETNYPANIIVSSFPEADSLIDKNTKIDVVISEVVENTELEREKIKQESIDAIIKKALKERENGSE